MWVRAGGWAAGGRSGLALAGLVGSAASETMEKKFRPRIRRESSGRNLVWSRLQLNQQCFTRFYIGSWDSSIEQSVLPFDHLQNAGR